MNRFIEIVRALKCQGGGAVACPQCGNLHISKSTGLDGWMLPTLYFCSECGYSGRLVLEVEKKDLALGAE